MSVFSPPDDLLSCGYAHEAVIVHAPCLPERQGVYVLSELLAKADPKVCETLEAKIVCCCHCQGSIAKRCINVMRVISGTEVCAAPDKPAGGK